MRKPYPDQSRVFYAIVALLCAAVIFTLLFFAYARRFDRTLMEENRSRLEEVSEHVAAFMERAVEQQRKDLRVVAAALTAVPEREARVAYLGRMAEEMGFEYIGLADENGRFHASAFRDTLDISREDYFLAARAGESFMTGLRRQVFWDRAVDGVILSVPFPGDGGSVVAAMVSTSKIGNNVQTDSFDGNAFSYIIDAQGNLVLHARSMAYNNLFQAMRNLTFEKGYSLEAMRDEIASRGAGMTAYSDLGVEKYAYYRPLRFNDWTVVSIVPKGIVTARTSALSRELILMCVVAALVLLTLLSVVGFLLLRLEGRKRANRAKSDFLANMSHDMRTPMNAIMGMAAIADAHAGESDTVRDCMRKISYSSKHLLGLINDVLDMSRIESGKMTLVRESFSLAEVLESVENMTFSRIHAKSQHFSMRIHGIKNERLLGDSLRLSQIFVNILTNAMKFTPEGGRITVDLEELPSEKTDTARFRFVFTDNGIGMKPEFLKDLFTPFTRERNSRVDNIEGSGLGMSITKRIVDLMGGRIDVSSAEGKGSVFTVTLPLLLDSAVPEDPVPQGPFLPAWKILLVGGDEGQGAEVSRTLADMGLSAKWTGDVAGAEICLAEEDCQAVFVDRAVYSKEGVALLQKSGAVLILTAYDWEDIRQEASRAGIRYFVQKPLLRSTLCQALRKAAGAVSKEVHTPPSIDLSGKRILLAEDNELNLEIAQTVLTGMGASVFWAADGAECVGMFEASPPGGYDLILMDIQMPRMNGYEAAARIRSSNRPDASLPILAMSANAFAEDIAAAAAAGMNGYLTKPIDLDVWIPEIGKSLRA